MKLLLIEDDGLATPRAEIELSTHGRAVIVKPGPSLPLLLRHLYEAESAVIEAIETGLKAKAPVKESVTE